MAAQDIIVLGGSAGAIEALSKLLGGLPSQLNAALFVVLHTSPQGGTALAQILERAGVLPVSLAIDNERYKRGRVYVAPPDHHLVLEDGALRVNRGPRENGFRPAVDPLFRSAAKQFGSRTVGIILSGALDDGTFGLMAIKEAGGTAIVQHPYEAFVPSMPLSAIQNVEVDHIVRVADMPLLLVQAAETGLRQEPSQLRNPAEGSQQADRTGRDITLHAISPDELDQPASQYVCPECGGALTAIDEEGMPRFRCYTGHGFTIDTLLAAQNGKLEHALWSAVRVLMERASLHRQMALRTSHRGMNASAEKYSERAEQEEKQADLIREMLSAGSILAEPLPPENEQTL